jgi:DNA modification methylase
MKQKMARYEMHKYWGKKPSKDLLQLIEKYSKVGDVVLDPFSGYGVFVCEAYLNGRNSIGNDLNPLSTFIQKQLLESDIDLDLFELETKRILEENQEYIDKWYTTKCPKCGKNTKILSTLRSKANIPLMNKIRCSCSKSGVEYELTDTDASEILTQEQNTFLNEHPQSKLIRNGRISVFDNMTTDDVFTKRTLECHSKLLTSINSIENENIRNLAKIAFTSNLANCSKLVPPIKTRGPMAPGAWMTGFYIGETYLENNVFHYFENRVAKVISGKKDFFNQNSLLFGLEDKGQVTSLNLFEPNTRAYMITNQDTKSLNLPDNSIDYIFTDPPYGDSVPYFEQSALWNTWLGFSVDYENEIVISDSKLREKRSSNFAIEIAACIREIYRVLKVDAHFSITFHSISGSEWYALTKACLEVGFSMSDIQWLTQKTFAPRQLNRKKTVKGDVLITFKKTIVKPVLRVLDANQTSEFIYTISNELLQRSKSNTNDIFITLLKKIFNEHILFENINFIEVLSNKFKIDDEGFWYI